jgi:hypothetical protein
MIREADGAGLIFHPEFFVGDHPTAITWQANGAASG